ncbi:MAG TPA: hypothetical protein VGC09_23000 [Rhodopila sp.]
MKRFFLVGILSLPLALGGCGDLPSVASATAAATASVSAEQARLQKVLDTWPIDKGILQTGAIGLTAAGQPAAAAVVTAGIAKGDQVVADAQAVLNTATVTVAALQTISDQFTDLVATLKSTAAPAISVVPTVPAHG